MSNEQIPFNHSPFGSDEGSFVENPEPRCACVLLLDTSGSMQGKPIAELNEGLVAFKDELAADALAAKRVEVSVVSFGPVRVEREFSTADTFSPPVLGASGDTPMGAAIERAIAMLEKRKSIYKSSGVNYYRPWIFLITDGAPTDAWSNAARLVKEGEEHGAFAFFAVGVQAARMDILAQMTTREPLKLSGLRFRDLFAWLSKSLQWVSRSQVGTQVSLPPPSGWTSV